MPQLFVGHADFVVKRGARGRRPGGWRAANASAASSRALAAAISTRCRFRAGTWQRPPPARGIRSPPARSAAASLCSAAGAALSSRIYRPLRILGLVPHAVGRQHSGHEIAELRERVRRRHRCSATRCSPRSAITCWRCATSCRRAGSTFASSAKPVSTDSTRPLIERMHAVGLRALTFGVESLSPDALRKVGRRPIRLVSSARSSSTVAGWASTRSRSTSSACSPMTGNRSRHHRVRRGPGLDASRRSSC